VFCPVCRSLLVPKEGKHFCRKCGDFREASTKPRIISAAKQEGREIVVLEEQKLDILPRTQDVECPKCGARDAWWFLRQTRKADEAETMFLECTKCHNRWRRY